jgi:hypothetical protein
MQKLVKKTYTNPQLPNKTLHNETKNKRIKMIQFAIYKVFKVRSTTFPHKKSTKKHGIKKKGGKQIK